MDRSRQYPLAARTILIMLFLPLLLLHSCSLRKYDSEGCSTNTECQQSFGFGSTCTETGFCEPAAPNSRCDALLPSDIFDNPIAYKDSYPVGVLFDSSADIAKISATALAIKEVQARGGLDGQDIIAIQCNYEDDTDSLFGDGLTGRDAVTFGTQYLSETLDIPLIIGPAGSDDSIAAYDVVKSTDAVLISPSATSEALTIIDGIQKSDDLPGLFWRTVGSDQIQAQVLANYILEYLLTTEEQSIAIIHQKSSYGEGFANTLNEAFEQNELVETYRYPFDDISENPWIDIAQDEDDIEALAFISSDVADITEFLIQIDSLPGFEDAQIFLPDAAAKDLLLLDTAAVSPALYSRIRGSRPSLPSGVIFDNFAASYEAYTGTSASVSVFSAFSYDATWIGLYGLIWAHYQGDPSSGLSIARGLRKLSEPSGMSISVSLSSWTDVMANFAEGRSIDVNGTSGALDFDDDTEETSNSIDIWAIEGTPGSAQFSVLETCDSSGICE